MLASQYSDLGVSISIVAAPAVVYSAGFAAGAFGASFAAATVLPVAFIAAPAYYFWSKNEREEDKIQIEEAFSLRRLSTPAIAGNGAVAGSYFFPIVPNPQKLSVEFSVEGVSDSKRLEISLAALAGLHVDPNSKVIPPVPTDMESEQEPSANPENQLQSSGFNSEVAELQLELTKRGYAPGPIDGMWGGKTKTALVKFQADNNLNTTGELDAATRALLAE